MYDVGIQGFYIAVSLNHILHIINVIWNIQLLNFYMDI